MTSSSNNNRREKGPSHQGRENFNDYTFIAPDKRKGTKRIKHKNESDSGSIFTQDQNKGKANETSITSKEEEKIKEWTRLKSSDT